MKNVKNKMALVALAVGVMSASSVASAFSYYSSNFAYGGIKAGALMLNDVEAKIDNEEVEVDSDELGSGAITLGFGRDNGSNSWAFELDVYATEKGDGEVAYDLNESDDIKDKADVKAKGAAASVAYRQRVQDTFDSTGMYLKAKAGLAYNKLDVEFGFGLDSEKYSDSDTNFLIGAGIGYYFNNRTSLELSYDYQDNGVGLASLAVNRNF